MLWDFVNWMKIILIVNFLRCKNILPVFHNCQKSLFFHEYISKAWVHLALSIISYKAAEISSLWYVVDLFSFSHSLLTFLNFPRENCEKYLLFQKYNLARSIVQHYYSYSNVFICMKIAKRDFQCFHYKKIHEVMYMLTNFI